LTTLQTCNASNLDYALCLGRIPTTVSLDQDGPPPNAENNTVVFRVKYISLTANILRVDLTGIFGQ
jgi:hypothetical protein